MKNTNLFLIVLEVVKSKVKVLVNIVSSEGLSIMQCLLVVSSHSREGRDKRALAWQKRWKGKGIGVSPSTSSTRALIASWKGPPLNNLTWVFKLQHLNWGGGRGDTYIQNTAGDLPGLFSYLPFHSILSHISKEGIFLWNPKCYWALSQKVKFSKAPKKG
jgi:hypothetical protein